MLYRRASREVEAIRFDGSERAARDISVMKSAAATILRGEIEVVTTFGRKVIRAGQWITRDRATGCHAGLRPRRFPRRTRAG